MASRRDQLQAHRFLVARVVSAVVTRQPDPEHPPFSRPSVAAVGSVAIAVLALVAVGIYGVVVPGGNRTWRHGDAVIVVNETGARYVYLDGRLHPVLNYTSALLALGRHAPTRSVSRRSLVGVARGPRIGIVDAPDALPSRDGMLSGGWTLCSQPGSDGTGATVDETVLLIGVEPAGHPLGDAAILVEVSGTGDHYLLWRGYRHRIRQPDTVAVGLALRAEPRARVGTVMVDVLPSGEPIAPIVVPRVGEPSTAVPRRPDLRVGQLLMAQTSGGGLQHYLVEHDRLRPISQFQYDIQLAYPATAVAYGGAEPVGMPLGLVAAAEARKEPAVTPVPGAAPPSRPHFARPGGGPAAVCATYDGGVSVPRMQSDVRLPPADPMTATAGRTSAGLPLADRVHVPPGRAALAEVMASGQAAVGTLVLVTDQGRAYPLASREVPGILGYAGVAPVRLPGGLVSRVPMGSGLDPATAKAR
ncbi:MAG TPA: type VII secretion protein EccB [Micromonosporaceae bacterium]|nr:type VII secretion protein EccB [Micromonosporaceae bacterium]